jgi:hypothetical protein
MQASPWRVDGHRARLEDEQFSAEIDLFVPSRGVNVISAAGAKLANAHLFKIRLPDGGRFQATNIESFARGDDLIAIHSEQPDNPFRAQIYWRLIRSIPPFEVRRSVAALELILSIQTSLLNSDPALDVETELPTVTVSQLTDGKPARFVVRSPTEGGTELEIESGVGCFQFATARGPMTYVEMVHPADFRRSMLAPGPRGLRLSHRQFAERLEKGVILRSRLRGMFVPVDYSPATIAAAYREFAASEPPLTV